MNVINIFVTWGVTALPLKEISSRDLRKEEERRKTIKVALIMEKRGYRDS
jgi:hypothetical protein